MPRNAVIKAFRGLKADLPILNIGELAITTDEKALYFSADGLVNTKVGPFPAGGIFLFQQISASDTWVVNHNLGQKLCLVVVTDSNDAILEPDSITYNDPNWLTITFSSPVSGWSLVSSGYSTSIGDLLDGSAFIRGNILPDATATRNLGSAVKTFNSIYAEHLYLSGNSLYVNGKPVIQDVSDTITVSTDVDQDLRLKTTGLGDILLISQNTVVIQADNGVNLTVPTTNPNKHYAVTNQSLGGNITFTATGTGSQVQFSAVDKIMFSSPVLDVNCNVDMGNFRILNLPNPTDGSEAATKAYVDANIGSGGGGGGVAFTVINTIVDLTTVNGDIVIANTDINGTIVITLTTAANAVVEIKNVGNGIITVIPDSGLIDDSDTFTIDMRYDAFKFVCDGTNWYIF